MDVGGDTRVGGPHDLSPSPPTAEVSYYCQMSGREVTKVLQFALGPITSWTKMVVMGESANWSNNASGIWYYLQHQSQVSRGLVGQVSREITNFAKYPLQPPLSTRVTRALASQNSQIGKFHLLLGPQYLSSTDAAALPLPWVLSPRIPLLLLLLLPLTVVVVGEGVPGLLSSSVVVVVAAPPLLAASELLAAAAAVGVVAGAVESWWCRDQCRVVVHFMS